jgi:hypothetical protein
MENWDMLIGVLLVIVFVLLVQRTMSPFRCQEGEEEKDGNCVSNSTKDRWWAFWESPKCKRGELQSDYTCLASMIMDAMSPGAASSPQAAVAAPAAATVDILQYFNRLVGLVERNFLNMSTDVGQGQEFTVNIGVANACPIQPGAKVNVNVTVKQSFDQASVNDFQNVLNEFYNALYTQTRGAHEGGAAARRDAVGDVIQKAASSENLPFLVNSTINYQTRLINIAECGSDVPFRLDEHFLATVIVGNILVDIGKRTSELIDKNTGATACPTQAAVMTLGSDGKPNGVLTGPGQTITRGTDDTYVPGKVRIFAPVAIDGVGKLNGTAFNIQLDKTPCEGTDVEIGNWARFDVKNPTQSEGVKTVGEGQMSQSSVQTAVEVSCKPRGFSTSNRSVCCSGNTTWNYAGARSECT